jgi:hypothetical protein
VVIRRVAVEKLAHFDFAKTASRQEALQAIFHSPGHFLSPDSSPFRGNPLFQQPQDLSTSIQLSARNRPRVTSELPTIHPERSI